MYQEAIPSSVRRRRQRSSIPKELLISDYIALAILLLLAAGIVWILGGNRMWIMAPMILLTLLAGEVFLARFMVASRRSTLIVPPGGIAAFLLVGYLALLKPWAEVPYDAGDQFFRFLSYAMAYWMWFNLLRYHQRWKWALGLVMLSVSIMACYAIMQDVHGSRMAVLVQRHDDYGMRASGAYVCPNHFAHLLHMLILISIGVLAAPGVGIPLKLFAGYMLAVGIYPLYLSLSRSGWIGLMAGLVVFAVAMAARKGARLFAVALIVAPLVVGALGALVWKLSPQVQARVEQALRGDVRITLWQDSLEIVKDAPWFGHGPGSYRYMYPSYHDKMMANRDPEFAHNDYIHFWAEMGLAGLVLGAALWLLIARRAIKVIRGGENNASPVLMCGLLAMIAGTLAHAFFDFNLNIFGNVHVMVFLVAAMMAASLPEKPDGMIDVSSRRSRLVGMLLMIILGVLIATYANRGLSYLHEVRGESYALSEKWPEAEMAFEQSIKWRSDNWRSLMLLGHVNRVQAFWMRRPDARAGLIDAGIECYEQAKAGNPWVAELWFGRGLLYRIEDKPEEALNCLREAVKRAPRYASHLNELGQQLRLMNRYAEAREVYMTSLTWDPTPIAKKNIEILDRWISRAAAADSRDD